VESTDSMEGIDHVCDNDTDGLTEMTDLNDIPSALIIAHIDTSVFEDKDSQEQFECVFRELDKDVTFIYLRNFRRARVQFSSSEFAAIARIRYDGVVISGSSIRCFFFQAPIQSDSKDLKPPKPTKMFLISPPASPPVGWEQAVEAEPTVNYELLHAISKLSPGESHTLVHPTLEAPAIIVHLCEDPEIPPPEFKAKIEPTKMPPRKKNPS